MSIEKLVSTLMDRLGTGRIRQDVFVAAKMLDMYGIKDIEWLYKKSKNDGFNRTTQQLIALSRGMSCNRLINEEEILDSVKEVYPILLSCVTYVGLREVKGFEKTKCIEYMERNCIEVPTPYLVILKGIAE